MDALIFLKTLTEIERAMTLSLCKEMFGDHLGQHIWRTQFGYGQDQSFNLYKFDLASQRILAKYIDANQVN